MPYLYEMRPLRQPNDSPRHPDTNPQQQDKREHHPPCSIRQGLT